MNVRNFTLTPTTFVCLKASVQHIGSSRRKRGYQQQKNEHMSDNAYSADPIAQNEPIGAVLLTVQRMGGPKPQHTPSCSIVTRRW